MGRNPMQFATQSSKAGSDESDQPVQSAKQTVQQALLHWPEFLMESGELGIFMFVACAAAALLEHPASPIHQALENGTIRRAVAGMVMGLTAICIIHSPWGKRSGAHLNPATTLTFLSLGKVGRWDGIFYVVAQFLGGVIGVQASELIIGDAISDTSVNYAVTVPGPMGVGAAFAAELVISFVLMFAVLYSSNTKKLARFTPFIAGSLVATYIFLEAPISGMSMNPARTFGSALAAQDWTALWIYFVAPPLGMFFAAQIYSRLRGAHRVFCAKLHHHNSERCIFSCNIAALKNGAWE